MGTKQSKQKHLSEQEYCNLCSQDPCDKTETYERETFVNEICDKQAHLIDKGDRYAYYVTVGLALGYRLCCIFYWSALEARVSKAGAVPYFFTKAPHVHALCPACMAEHFKL